MSLPRRVLLLIVLAAGLLLGAAGPASAHPALVSSSPGAGYAVTDAPRELVLSFNEQVSLPSRPVTLLGAGGSPVEVRVVVDGPTVRATPTRALAVGAYELAYRVVG
ncbi:MAG: copper resistance protein CopC, partial [Frankiales bacterium]|nr:copper resistance protein CopC [Frankiales bacterium]